MTKKPILCDDTTCTSCDFLKNHQLPCTEQRKEWLEAQHEPLYKQGDVVIYDITDELFVVTEDEYDNFVTVSRFANLAEGEEISINHIRKKVGSIYD